MCEYVNNDTFRNQCDISSLSPNIIRGNTAVNTSVGRRGSCDTDGALAPPGGLPHIPCRGVVPMDLRGRVALSAAAKSHIFTQVHLHIDRSHLDHGSICGEQGEI